MLVSTFASTGCGYSELSVLRDPLPAHLLRVKGLEATTIGPDGLTQWGMAGGGLHNTQQHTHTHQHTVGYNLKQ